MDPTRKAVLQTVFRWAAGMGGGSAGLTGGLDMLSWSVLGLPVPLLLGAISSLAGLGLGILDKIPDRSAKA